MNHRTDSATTADLRSFVGKTILGNYLLREYIDEGNFGVLFKSEQQFLGVPVRRVAVKISKQTEIDMEKVKDIFADVFLLAGAMDEMTDSEAKSHLVHVYDAGILSGENNRAFLVMEYIDGTTLADQFKSYGRVPAPIMMKWVRQICRALKELHTLVPPVLHRDMKPSNVLLGIDGCVRVVDFGLAAKMTRHGFVPGTAGTITYMAPETIRGESIPASDVYSTGIILYEGLTGKHPFAGFVPPINLPSAAYNDWIYEQKSTFRPSPPSLLNNTVTPRLDEVVLRCLEFRPAERRYHNAGALLKALDDSERPPSQDENALDEGRRLRAKGDLTGARDVFETGLRESSNSKEIRFELLKELGEVLALARDPKAASGKLVEAWNIAKNSGVIFRRQEERANFLGQIIEAFRSSKNYFQAERYERERAALLPSREVKS